MIHKWGNKIGSLSPRAAFSFGISTSSFSINWTWWMLSWLASWGGMFSWW
jgi:heme O synthase-like polyprenyltransferase